MSGLVTAVDPSFHSPTALHEGLLVWHWPEPMQMLSSAPVRGGFVSAHWLLNIGVDLAYRRIDLGDHAREIAQSLELAGDGVALLTAAQVADYQHASVGRADAFATLGISKPTWAADPAGGWSPWQPGTVNIVVQLETALEPAAAVNAVMTATEAKTQAFCEAGISGTGTASDAVVIVWPASSAAPSAQFAGPRSEVGAEIAIAVHRAVAAGIDVWLAARTDESAE